MAKKYTPHRKDPHLLELQTLSFDNVSNEELSVLTAQDKSAIFLVTFMDTFDPFVRFKNYFASSAKSNKHILREIKNFYVRLVENGSWTEKKYAKALVRIFETGLPLDVMSLDRVGLQLDRNSSSKRRGRL